MPFAPALTQLPVALPVASATAGPTGDHPALPLFGLTLLAVEDSRLACDALRLMCQRSGARLRRAETLRCARLHLSLYRPDVVLVDMGLPDGSGATLIRDLADDPSHPCRVLAMSADPAARHEALGAGAAAFIDKPIAGLRAFQTAILEVMGNAAGGPPDQTPPDQTPPDQTPPDQTPPDQTLPAPDAAALRDDLARAADWLRNPAMRAKPGFLAGFVAGIARQSGDDALLRAATRAHQGGAGLDALADTIATRQVSRKHV